jgi:probable F420-dependent oxidoreductase
MAPDAPLERHHDRAGTVRLSVVLGQWLDRSIEADLQLAAWADELGYGQLWVPEMAKVDAPAFAAIVAERTAGIELVLGPLAVTVRSPVQIALAATTVAAGGRATHVALGTSSSLVARWHGRTRAGAAERLEQTRADVVALLDGDRVHGYRLPQPPRPTPTVTVAAFGPRAVESARGADRMVLNMVTVEGASRLAPQHPNTAVWLCAAVEPSDEERAWLSRGLVGYLAAPGYGEMFVEAGFGDLVEFARTHPGPKQVFARMPPDLIDQVGLVGSESEIRDRMAAYAAAGIAEICLVPPAPDLPCSRRTLELLAPADGVRVRSSMR